MKKQIGCFACAFFLSLGLTACQFDVPPPIDDAAPSDGGATTTSTTVSAAPTATATTTTTQESAAPTTITTTATQSTAAPATTSTAPQKIAVPSPLADVSVTKIELYDADPYPQQEAVFVKAITDAATIQEVAQRLSAAAWAHYPSQDGWVKYNPLYAKWALVLTEPTGKQWVLHLYSADGGWAAVGCFDGNGTYSDILQQAKAEDQQGADPLGRYTIDAATLSYLLSLF